MINGVSRGKDGRLVVFCGLTDVNLDRLRTVGPVYVDLIGLDEPAALVIMHGVDVPDLLQKSIDLGLTDRSVLDAPAPTPQRPTFWERDVPE